MVASDNVTRAVSFRPLTSSDSTSAVILLYWLNHQPAAQLRCRKERIGKGEQPDAKLGIEDAASYVRTRNARSLYLKHTHVL